MTDDRDTAPTAVTQLLMAWDGSDKRVLDQMLPPVYAELHRLAAHYLSLEPTGHTLQPTALVHEAYLRLIDQRQVNWRSRGQFDRGETAKAVATYARLLRPWRRADPELRPVLEAVRGRVRQAGGAIAEH